jgi:predicted DNA-binding antitoxin AbrB/MazE fold protein
MMQSIRTIEAIYEHGYLRPLQPIEGCEGLVYLVRSHVKTTSVF